MTIYFNSLNEELKAHLERSQNTIELYSPYITLSAISNVMEVKRPHIKASIITTWKVCDLKSGISDLDLYSYCKDNGIFLFVNNRLHLKSYMTDFSKILSGSANLTQKGLGIVSNSNYETLIEVPASKEYLLFLAKIKKESTLVTKNLYDFYCECLRQVPDNTHDTTINSFQDLIDSKLTKDKYFLISALPMTKSIELLYDYVCGKDISDPEVVASARHDIVNYELDRFTFASFEEFKQKLSKAFFAHPFILELCNFVSEPRRFGAIKEWVQNNCTDVPIPSRRSLTDNVQVLYNWFVDLGSDRYEVTRPNFSELLMPKQVNK